MTDTDGTPKKSTPRKVAAKKSSPPAKKAAPAAAKKSTTAKKAATSASNAALTTKKAAAPKKPVTGQARKPTGAESGSTKRKAVKKTVSGTSTKKPSRLDAAREKARSAPGSKFFLNARKRAQKILDDPEALKKVADESYKSGASRSGPFAAVMDDFRALVRLVVAYARGNYRDIPADSLLLVVAGLIYVVSPIDLIPDAIPVMGFADDAAVIGWVIKSVRGELDSFRAWELGQEDSGH